MLSVLFFPSCLTRSAVSLNVFLFILLPSLVSLWIVGYRAQLSADAGQRRPSQKEKYVRPRDYLSPLCHHAPDTPTPSPSTLLSLWIGGKCLHFPPEVAPFWVPPPVEPIIQSKGFPVHECVT